MKFCRDCKHYDSRSTRCVEEHSLHTEPVMGETRYYSASVLRQGFTKEDCGKDAQYFRPRIGLAA